MGVLFMPRNDIADQQLPEINLVDHQKRAVVCDHTTLQGGGGGVAGKYQRGGGGVWDPKSVYQKWPDQIFPIVTSLFPQGSSISVISEMVMIRLLLGGPKKGGGLFKSRHILGPSWVVDVIAAFETLD